MLKPRKITPTFFIPAFTSLSRAPIQSSRSGFTGFFTNTGISVPLSESASSCIANGLAAVLAPIQRISIPALIASNTCAAVATSVATSIPVSCFTSFNQGRPTVPTPSNPPGLVLGFQMPALKILTPFLANSLAVHNTCSRLSALQGPAIIMGRSEASIPGKTNFSISIS